jgi:glycosyltransferase involved in cell wall biosynthesis
MKVLLANLHKYVGYSGGIEHVLSHMASALKDRNYEVSVVMADEKEGFPFYPLPDGVELYNLFHMEDMKAIHAGTFDKIIREVTRAFSKEGARNRNYEILLKGKKALQKVLEETEPEVIVSFREPTGRLLLDGISTKIPVISMLHNDPDEIFLHSPKEEKNALKKSRFIQALMPSFIGKAEKYLDYDHFVYIPNAVNIPDLVADPGQDRDVHVITNVGRVTGRTKRQHLLVEAFSLIAKDFPNWQVHIWGDTYDKAYVTALKSLIKKKGITDRVFLKGTTKDMKGVWEGTDIFAFPSHHEGFPLALSEAMGVGIPAVGYKTCSSVNELIKSDVNGYLVEEGPEPFSKALAALMKDEKLRRKLGKGARESMESFRPEVVWNSWDELLQKAAK